MKKKLLWLSAILFAVLLGGFAYSLRPKCDLIADEALIHFSVPIEQRTDRDFYLKVFQKKADGHWYQCKTALSRTFFF
ncbi:hypothetical protein [Bdellovibrio sp. HCB337]|uniref:hypothetical protein n=1 Tax=Bdellovibrio sp. HCB337 TaxID=3394358 RepID=UPI0039A4545C